MRSHVCASLALALALSVAGLVRADDQADIKAVLDKAIKAHGGEDKLTKLKAATLKLKGKWYGMGEGIDYTGDWFMQGPDKFRFDITVEIMGMTFMRVQVVSGDQGWVKDPTGTKELDKDGLQSAKAEMYAGQVESLIPLKDKAFMLSSLGEDKVAGRPVVGIRVAHKDRADINLYFDKETHLLVKSVRNVKDEQTGGQEVTQETYHQDYKEAQGLRYASKMEVKRDGKRYVDGEVTEFKASEKLDDSVFAKP